MLRLAAAGVAGLLGLSGCAFLDTEPGPATRAADAAGPCSVESGDLQKFPTDTGKRLLTARVPAGADATTELVVALHPAGGSAGAMQFISGFDALAERDDAIVVYPQQSQDPELGGAWDQNLSGPDVTYIESLIGYLHAHGCGSPATTNVIGFSSGAMLTSRVLCRQPNIMGSAAMVAGALAPPPKCTAPTAVDIFVVHGTDDEVVGFNTADIDYIEQALGWVEGPGDRVEVARRWSELKGCDAAGEPSVFDGALVTTFACPNTAPTTAVAVPTGRHEWQPAGFPTSDYLWSEMIGN